MVSTDLPLEMICFRVSGASTEQWPHLHFQSHTRACIAELFTVFVYNKKNQYSTKFTDLKGGTKAGQKSFFISDVFTMVATYLIIQYFLENCLTSSTAPLPFLFCSPYLLARMTGIYHLSFVSTLTCINISRDWQRFIGLRLPAPHWSPEGYGIVQGLGFLFTHLLNVIEITRLWAEVFSIAGFGRWAGVCGPSSIFIVCYILLMSQFEWEAISLLGELIFFFFFLSFLNYF